MKVTLDNNCLISLDNEDNDATDVRRIVDLHNSKAIQVFIPAIAASENQLGGKLHKNFKEFEQFLRKIGCDNCYLLNPLVYLDVTYLDHCVLGPSSLEEPIHKILFPKMPFKYVDYYRSSGIHHDIVDRKWRNAKCDVQAMWCHIHYSNDIFITNDDNFHKVTKKPELIALGAKEIIRPEKFVGKFLRD